LPWPVHLRAGTPIAQILFECLDEPTEQPYPEDAKYQDQKQGAQAAILERAA
jgi:deoxycytidine triphosphate deaminase